ncbi:MAG: hypothetical protein CMJ78_08685 [Planctomycetaceae bacterium]|nr:hypothetical protein [Planctomycetaceae bacterium]
MDHELTIFISLSRQPRMYVQSDRFDAVCAYMDGYDAALRGRVLNGFRHWLLSEGDEWSNLPWWGIVRRNLFPDQNPADALSKSGSDEALEALACYLEQFCSCIKVGGLQAIYAKYNAWLLSRTDDATAEFRDRILEIIDSEKRRHNIEE